MQFSHSRVSTFKTCPAQFNFRYNDKLKTVHAPDPDDPGIVGNALHTGVEKGETEWLDFYYSQFAIIDDQHVNEGMKLSVQIPKLKNFLNSLDGEFKHEYLIDRPDYKGFIDLIVTVNNPDGTVDIYDFKYSNNVDRYLKSEQLHLYKFYLEREKFKVNRMAYVFVPKITTIGKFAKVKQKKDESLLEFRKRFMALVHASEIDVRYIDYDFSKVKEFWESCSQLEAAKEFPKNPTRLCDWCDYNKFCLEGDDSMILPNNERREISSIKRKTLWIYGAPFSGKTWFANCFPSPLMLNTDGNIDFVDAPYLPIKDEVTVEGRITKRKLAWEGFKETIAELEKKQNTFQTIIVDLLEDCYEHCRIYMYGRLGIEHESDNSFKAWDMVKTEFLSTMKRLLNLPYDIVLISHEDMTKDFTKKTGDKVTRIAPNIQEKAGLKIAGMVQIVARVINDDDVRWLTFKTSEVEFGGGRLGVKARKISLEYAEFTKLYEEVNAGTGDKPAAEPEKPKRNRKVKEAPTSADPASEPVNEQGNEPDSDQGQPTDADAPPVEQDDSPEPTTVPESRSRRSRSTTASPEPTQPEPTNAPAASTRQRRSRS